MPGNFVSSETIGDVSQTALSPAMMRKGPLQIPPPLDGDDDDGQDRSQTLVYGFSAHHQGWSGWRSQAVHDCDTTQMELCEDTISSFAQV